jgi:23S rRNA pseudouridine2605 synthase
MKRTDNFHKFVKQPKGSAIKEQIRQDKKKEKKERAEAIERHFAKKREERALHSGRPIENAKGVKAASPKKANSKYSSPKTSIDKKETRETTAPVGKKEFEKKAPNAKVAPAKAPNAYKPIAKDVKASKSEKTVSKSSPASSIEQMPLNKYIAHSGICSRRDAAILVKEGKVMVNDVVATDPGTKVTETDIVKVNGKRSTPSKNFVYILLNKPKDFITTLDDPQGRRTVVDLVKHATTERVYPIGRLDRNTSGVLLLTNDGDLAQKLSHPKHEIKKVYEVKLDRNLTKGDMDKIASGITLEDGFVAPDVIAYADSKDKSIIGIEIHSGRNRIVRRIFEHMKYDVKALDRVMYAGLTKKNVQRGNWRFLSEKEVRLLKFMNQSFVKDKS